MRAAAFLQLQTGICGKSWMSQELCCSGRFELRPSPPPETGGGREGGRPGFTHLIRHVRAAGTCERRNSLERRSACKTSTEVRGEGDGGEGDGGEGDVWVQATQGHPPSGFDPPDSLIPRFHFHFHTSSLVGSSLPAPPPPPPPPPPPLGASSRLSSSSSRMSDSHILTFRQAGP